MGLRGGDEAAVLLVAVAAVIVLGRQLDSIEYCLDSTEVCRGECVLQKYYINKIENVFKE